MMKIFPQEFSDHVTPLHRLAAILSVVAILSGIIGMIVFFTINIFSLAPQVRKILGVLILGGPPLGLILLSIANVSLRRRYRTRQMNAQVRSRAQSVARAETLKGFEHIRYDYHSQSKSLLLLSAILFLFMVVIVVVWYTYSRHPWPLYGGVILLFVLAAGTAIYWAIWTRQWVGSYVRLADDGVHFRDWKSDGFIPWDWIKEIKPVRAGYIVKGDNTEFLFRNEIEPAEREWKGFLKELIPSEPYAKNLIEQMKMMNPHIVYLEPLLERHVPLPVSDRIMANSLVVSVIVLLVIAIVFLVRNTLN